MTSLIRKIFSIALGALTAFGVMAAVVSAVQAKNMEIVVWAPADQNERYRFEAV